MRYKRPSYSIEKLPPSACVIATSALAGRSVDSPLGTRSAMTARANVTRSRAELGFDFGINGEAFSAAAVRSRIGIIEFDGFIETLFHQPQRAAR